MITEKTRALLEVPSWVLVVGIVVEGASAFWKPDLGFGHDCGQKQGEARPV